MTGLFTTVIAAITGELPWMTRIEREEPRLERPRRERRDLRPARVAVFPRHGYRPSMRGLK